MPIDKMNVNEEFCSNYVIPAVIIFIFDPKICVIPYPEVHALAAKH